MPITVVTPSNALPVSMEAALQHLRVLETDTPIVQLYLLAAADLVEDYTGRSLITKTFCLTLDNWPKFRSLFGWNTRLQAIELRRSPLISIDSVKYYPSGSSTLTTIDSANYRADVASEPGRVVFIDGYSVPSAEKRADAVQIQFQAGYGVAESKIDPSIRLAILELAHNFFDNRTPIGDSKLAELPLNIRHILRAKRVESLAPIE